MRRSALRATLLLLALSAGACDEKPATLPPPQEITASSTAEFCGMAMAEHPGPKGQIFLAGKEQPLWFASVHDAFAFTMLPETPKNLAVIYVSDMGKAKNWDQPEAGSWIDAKKAVFVIGSARHGGMGEDEAVPFSEEAAAQAFARENGGRLVGFADMPRSYILPNGDAPTAEEHADHDHPEKGSEAHGHQPAPG